MATIEVTALMGQLQSLHSRIADFEDVNGRMQDQIKRLSFSLGQKVSKDDFDQTVYEIKESINHVESEFSQSQLDTHCLESKVSTIYTQMAEHEVLKQVLQDVQIALEDTATLSQIAEMKSGMESFFATVVQIDEFKASPAPKSSAHVGDNPQIDICEPEVCTVAGHPLESLTEGTTDRTNVQTSPVYRQQGTVSAHVGDNPQIDICEPEVCTVAGRPLESLAKNQQGTNDDNNVQIYPVDGQQETGSSHVGNNLQTDIYQSDGRAIARHSLKALAQLQRETDYHRNVQTASANGQQGSSCTACATFPDGAHDVLSVQDTSGSVVFGADDLSTETNTTAIVAGHEALVQLEDCAAVLQPPQALLASTTTPPMIESSDANAAAQMQSPIVGAAALPGNQASEVIVGMQISCLPGRSPTPPRKESGDANAVVHLQSSLGGVALPPRKEATEVSACVQMPSPPGRAVTPPRKEASEVSGHRPSGRSSSTIHIRRATSEASPGGGSHILHQHTVEALSGEQAASEARAFTPPRKEASAVSGYTPSRRSGSTLHIRRGTAELGAGGVAHTLH